MSEKKKKKQHNNNNCLCFIDYTKSFDCVDHDKLWKALREMDIPDHLTCLLGILYAGQGTTVRALYQDFLVTQLVMNLPEMQETLVQFLGWEDLLEKGTVTKSSILAWRIPQTV